MIIFWPRLTAVAGTVCDYPDVSDVRRGVLYDDGNLEGELYVPETPAPAAWAPTDAQAGIFTTLANDDDLIDLLGEDSGTVDVSTRVVDHVPDNSNFPYVTMQIKPWTDRGNHSKEGWECELQVNVWYQPGTASSKGRGDKQVQLIQKRIDELLHNREICIGEWNTLQLRRTFVDIITSDDNVTRHGIQRFKLYLGGN